MTTEHIRNAIEHAGSPNRHPLITKPAAYELRAIEQACADLYVNGFTGMSDESRNVLFSVGAFAHGEESK